MYKWQTVSYNLSLEYVTKDSLAKKHWNTKMDFCQQWSRAVQSRRNVWFLCISVNLSVARKCRLLFDHFEQVPLILLHSNVTNLACALTNTANIHRDRTMHKYLSNIQNYFKYFQGRDYGPLADGNSGGLPLLPLHQDHCQLLRGCPSKHQQMMIIVKLDGGWLELVLWVFLSASGAMWLANDSANSEKALLLGVLWAPHGRQIIVSTVKSRWSWAAGRYWQTFQTCYNLSQSTPLSPTQHWWWRKWQIVI